MLRKIIFFCLLTLAFSTKAAMTANQVLDNVIASFSKNPSITLTLNISDKNSKMVASITMAKEKFTFTSGQMTVYFDGTTQWTVDKDASEVSITNPTMEELVETNPLAFLQNFNKNYTSKIKSESKGTYTLQMKSKTKKAYIRDAEVTINSSNWLPVKINATLSTGQTVVMNITSNVVGKSLPLTAFQFDVSKHPGLEVVDLR